MKDINLIPQKYISGKVKKAKKRKTVLGILAAVIVLISAFGYVFWTRYTLSMQAQSMMKEIETASAYEDIQRQYQLIADLYKQREEQGSMMRSSGLDIPQIMEKLEKAVPDGLFILTLSSPEAKSGYNELTLGGVARTQDAIATLVGNLRKEGYFDNVVLSSVVKNQTLSQESVLSGGISPDSEYSFSIVAYFNGGE